MRVAVVTGASSGIGRGAALRLAKEGYNLVICGRNNEELQSLWKECVEQGLEGEQIAIVVGDVCDEAVIQNIIHTAISTFGQIDTLVNSAGILKSGPVADAPIEDYDALMEVNVRSIVRLTKAALPHIIKTKGTVVNVSSITGPCPFPGVTYYCMTKAALDQFTKCLALEMAPHGVRVNAVCPGVIVTNVHKRAGMDEEAYAAFLEKGKVTHALGRVGQVEEVAEAILFLASERSSFTTGELLRVDGGRGIMHPR